MNSPPETNSGSCVAICSLYSKNMAPLCFCLPNPEQAWPKSTLARTISGFLGSKTSRSNAQHGGNEDQMMESDRAWGGSLRLLCFLLEPRPFQCKYTKKARLAIRLTYDRQDLYISRLGNTRRCCSYNLRPMGFCSHAV